MSTLREPSADGLFRHPMGFFSRGIVGFLEWYTQNGVNTTPENREPCTPKLGYSVYTPIYFKGEKSQRGVLKSHTDGGMQDSCSAKKNELTAVFTKLTDGVHVDVGRLTPEKDGYFYKKQEHNMIWHVCGQPWIPAQVVFFHVAGSSAGAIRHVMS